MSRRRSRTPLDILVEADWQQAQAEQYWDTIPEPEVIPDWQEVWAPTLLDVVERVWRRQSSRMYYLHRDALLKDDLHSWLVTHAWEVTRAYTPNWYAQDPEQYFGAWLWKTLNEQAKWHFQKAVGQAEEAVAAHQRGIGSIEGLIETHGGDFFAPRHALHARPLEYRDPATVVTAIEDIERRVAEVEHLGPLTPRPEGRTTETPVCEVMGCHSPTHGGTRLCRKHYDADRWLWNQPKEECGIPDCHDPLAAIGLCNKHKTAWYDNRLREEYHQYVIRKEDRPPKPPCLVPDCEVISMARGLCSRHYKQFQTGKLDPSIELPAPTRKGQGRNI